ncbi:MAG: TetR family transcriptional regulator [Acidimicrobiia bacterium]|nr:TetR family transcriptional regulator [Acidimicrobiia bacterium]
MRYRVGIETRTRILDATRELLGEFGIEAITIKAICEHADILPGSFYNLFNSKEEVILTVIGETIQGVDEGDLTDETLGEVVDRYVRFVLENEILARVYLRIAVEGGLGTGELRERILGHHRARADRFESALKRSDPDADRSQAEAILAALNGYSLQYLIDQKFDLPHHANKLVELFS